MYNMHLFSYFLLFHTWNHCELNALPRPIGLKWVAAWIGVLFEQKMKLWWIGHNKTSCA
jgi:hypothetical protein